MKDYFFEAHYDKIPGSDVNNIDPLKDEIRRIIFYNYDGDFYKSENDNDLRWHRLHRRPLSEDDTINLKTSEINPEVYEKFLKNDDIYNFTFLIEIDLN